MARRLQEEKTKRLQEEHCIEPQSRIFSVHVEQAGCEYILPKFPMTKSCYGYGDAHIHVVALINDTKRNIQ